MGRRTSKRHGRQQKGTGAISNSGLTPLLDMLFLLLFAILASSDSSSAKDSRPEEVHVALPTVDPLESGEGDEVESVRIFLRIDADDSVTILTDDGPRPTPTSGELRDALEEVIIVAGDPSETIVEIRADADARHGVTVDVLQTVRAVGIVDVRFVATTGPGDTDDARILGGSHGGSDRGPR